MKPLKPKKKTIKKAAKKKAGSLRTRAESVLAKQKERLRELSTTDLKKLVHELGTHQIELEMQNEELRSAQGALESSRARYSDLYDFSPVGHFSFDKNGLIREVNLTAAAMLGSTKQLLLNKRILPFIHPAHLPVFRNHLHEVFRTETSSNCEITLIKQDGGTFDAQLNSRSFITEDGDAGLCRTAVINVTERKRAEDALKNSETRYRSLFENMLDGYAYCQMLYDDHGRAVDFVYLHVNIEFERLTGLKNVIGKKVSEVIPGIKASNPELFEIYNRVASTGKPENFEIDFKPLALWLSISVYSTERGHFVAVFDNITKRKRAESVMKARSRMLGAATASLSVDAALQMTIDEIEAQTGSTIGFYHFLAPDQERLSLQAWSTNTIRKMCSAEGKGNHYNISQAGVWVDCVRERGAVIHNDYASLPHRRGMPPGHAAVVREMVVPVMRGGRIVAIIGVGNKPTDYTAMDVEIALALGDLSWEIVERIRIQDALQKAKDLSDALNRINKAVHSTFDFNEIMRRVIKEAGDAIGCDSAAISVRENGGWVVRHAIGFSVDVVGSRMSDEQEPHAVLALKMKKPIIINDAFHDLRLNTDHMKTYDVRSVLVVPLIAGEQPLGVMFFNHHGAAVPFSTDQVDFADKLASTITLAIENARLFEERQRIRYELEAMNIELEAFSYSVSHDLRAPLRSIEGFTTAILEDCAPALYETGRGYFNRVVAASRRMSQLIDALLTLARLTRSEIKQKDVNLSALAEIIAHELRKKQPKRQVELLIAQGVKVRGDMDMLRIVLENLLDNAWKFTSDHPAAQIEFGATRMEDKIVYFVRDDGAGFLMEFAGKLFKPFKRLHAESEFPGIGIGLATVDRIISRHGGRIWAEADVEKGATFYFTL